jgi:hypothetical protein
LDPRHQELPAVGPYAVALGAALITMVEPHPGFELQYNRWYEDDHYYAGGLAMPWLFAGRRWVAPAGLRALRYPQQSPIAVPITTGRYITLYWVTEGRSDDQVAWSTAINHRLRADGRNFPQRDHVFTAFQDYVGPIYRDTDGPRDIHALDYPYHAMIMEVVDATDEVALLLNWLRQDYVPSIQRHSPLAQTLVFRAGVAAADAGFADVAGAPNPPNRITLLHFVDDDPLAHWDRHFAGHDELVRASKLGELALCAPFFPTWPGSDRYALD